MRSSICLLASAVLLLASGCKKEEATAVLGSEQPARATAAHAKSAFPNEASEEASPAERVGATVSGIVTLNGKATDTSIAVTKDVAVCAPDGLTERPAGAVLVADGVKNTVVYIDGIEADDQVAERTVGLAHTACLMSPRVIIARVGDTLAIKNNDEVFHNTRLRLDGHDVLTVALPTKGQVVKRTLNRPGIIEVGCDLHGWTRAWIHVLRHQHAVVTGDDGSFTLSGVPAGQYRIRAWHESLGATEAQVEVGNEDIRLDLQITSLRYTLGQKSPSELDPSRLIALLDAAIPGDLAKLYPDYGKGLADAKDEFARKDIERAQQAAFRERYVDEREELTARLYRATVAVRLGSYDFDEGAWPLQGVTESSEKKDGSLWISRFNWNQADLRVPDGEATASWLSWWPMPEAKAREVRDGLRRQTVYVQIAIRPTGTLDRVSIRQHPDHWDLSIVDLGPAGKFMMTRPPARVRLDVEPVAFRVCLSNGKQEGRPADADLACEAWIVPGGTRE